MKCSHCFRDVKNPVSYKKEKFHLECIPNCFYCSKVFTDFEERVIFKKNLYHKNCIARNKATYKRLTLRKVSNFNSVKK